MNFKTRFEMGKKLFYLHFEEQSIVRFCEKRMFETC